MSPKKSNEKSNELAIALVSGGMDSLFSNLLNKNKIKEIEKLILDIKKVFNESFYLEIQRHNDEGEKNLENIFLYLSKKNNIPIIA